MTQMEDLKGYIPITPPVDKRLQITDTIQISTLKSYILLFLMIRHSEKIEDPICYALPLQFVEGLI